jgi:hypothetical protein
VIEPTMAFTLFDKLLAALGLLREEKRARSTKIDAALTALYKALNKTRPYLEIRAHGAPQDRTVEFEIAAAWQDASIPLREIDPELAERCFMKGGYWMEPHIWSDAAIREKGIAFAQVFESTRLLLKK